MELAGGLVEEAAATPASSLAVWGHGSPMTVRPRYHCRKGGTRRPQAHVRGEGHKLLLAVM